MSPKTYLITGATAGIGLATATALARQGAIVVAVGRNAAKGREITARIRQETGNAAVEFLTADLSSQAEVRRVAQEFKAGHARLDVLVNNVGAFFMSRQLSADGVEMTWALNYLGVYLLTELLLDTLTASAPARIVNVSSDMHRNARWNFDDLQGERKHSGMKAYGQAKLALVLYTYDLARRLTGAGVTVTVNALHPGFVASDIYKGAGAGGKLVSWLIRRMALSPEAGAETSVYLATSPEVEGITGQYFVKKKAVRSGPASCDTAAGQRLMQISAEMTGG